MRVPCTQSLRYVQRARRLAAAPQGGDGGGGPGEGKPCGGGGGGPFLLRVASVGGHFGEGGRYRKLERLSTEAAFLIRTFAEGEAGGGGEG